MVTPLSTGKFYDNLIKCVRDRSVHCAQKQVNTYADHALVPCSRSCAGVDPGSIWKNNNQLEVNKMSVISMKQLLEAGADFHFFHLVNGCAVGKHDAALFQLWASVREPVLDH